MPDETVEGANMLTRELTIESEGGKDKVYPVTISTETPYLREDRFTGEPYFEVLDHTPNSIDLSRAPLPLIESHDNNQLNIGLVENLRVESRKLRGDLKLGNSARADEVARDIESGIVRNVSIGYQTIDKWDDGSLDDIPQFRFAFFPHEVSLVSIPADINAGIYRSHNMTDETEETLTRSQKKSANRTLEDERNRVTVIDELADFHGNADGVSELGRKAIKEGWDVDRFNRHALELVGEYSKKARTDYKSDPHATYTGMPADNGNYGRAINDYSLARVLRGMADPKELSKAGLELEISQEMQHQTGRKSKGILVPFDVLRTRAVTYSGTGANVVADNLEADSFIDVFRPRSQVLRLGATTLRGLAGNVEIPKKTAGASGSWIAGDDSDSITASDMTLSQVTMAPHVVGGATTFSHRMLMQSTPDIETIVRQDLAALIATEIDNKALNGDGVSTEPTGLLNIGGVNTSTITAAGDPDYDEIIEFETQIANDNADMGNMAYLTTSAVRGALKLKEVSSGTGIFTWSPGREAGEGLLNGYRALVSNNMPTNGIVFGNWSELMVGFWGGIELDADPYGSNFLKGSVTVRALADVDVAVRHPESFCKSA